MSDGTWVRDTGYFKGEVRPPVERKPKARRKPRKAARPESPVTVTRAHPKALREALRLAEGDASRLSVQSDGSVVVNNESRRKNA